MRLADFWRKAGLVLLAIGSGTVWAVVLVDFPPIWFHESGPVVKALVLSVPLIVHFVCALLLPWWSAKQCVLYSSIVVLCNLAGVYHNEIAETGNFEHLWDSAWWFGDTLTALLYAAVVFMAAASGWAVAQLMPRRRRNV